MYNEDRKKGKMMVAEIEPEDLEQVRTLSEMILELIHQFKRTKEELMRTTLKVQIEVLKGRLKRLTASILEIKKSLDLVCIPKEAKEVEEKIKNLPHPLMPYVGATLLETGEVEDFVWKSCDLLESEKEENLSVSSDYHFFPIIEKIYAKYEAWSSQFVEENKKVSGL